METNRPIPASSSSIPIDSAAPSSSQIPETQENRVEGSRGRIRFNLPSGVSYRFNLSVSDVSSSTDMHDDVWSCLIVLLTFWFFASTTMILGFYGSVSLNLGPNCSRLVHANPIFVQTIKVVEMDQLKHGPMLYGFDYPPPLDVEVVWSETHHISLRPDLHKDWIYFLNGGSELNISCSVTSLGSTSVHLVVAEGRESFVGWIHNPTYPNSNLIWNIINGSGEVRLKVSQSSTYYVAVGNLNPEEVQQVRLNLSLKVLQYNTSLSNYICSVGRNLCKLNLFITGRNTAVLTTPPAPAELDSMNWEVKLSYGPRWIAYFLGSAVMTVGLLLAFKFCISLPGEARQGYQPQGGEGDGRQEGRAPLLRKDDDSCSWGSSYDSVSPDEEALVGEKMMGGEGESGGGACVICFDAPRDCFFLPCGHHATCFTCGTRIAEEDGACPICRRKTRKVRRIYSV